VFPTHQDLDPGRLREVFGIFPSGVVAALVGGAPVGLAASSFTSVSLDPPLVSFSIANASKTWPDLRRAAHLGTTILADHHSAAPRTCHQPTSKPCTNPPNRASPRRRPNPLAATRPGAVQVAGVAIDLRGMFNPGTSPGSHGVNPIRGGLFHSRSMIFVLRPADQTPRVNWIKTSR
jgi:hypothetical protein